MGARDGHRRCLSRQPAEHDRVYLRPMAVYELYLWLKGSGGAVVRWDAGVGCQL